jgi:hypothetical protein
MREAIPGDDEPVCDEADGDDVVIFTCPVCFRETGAVRWTDRAVCRWCGSEARSVACPYCPATHIVHGAAPMPCPATGAIIAAPVRSPGR